MTTACHRTVPWSATAFDEGGLPRAADPGKEQATATGFPVYSAGIVADIQWQPDILGEGYTQTVLELGTDPDGEGQIAAVLVRREPQDGEVTEGAVLYVHGFSDYFFQTALADFFASHGLAFYALDLVIAAGRGVRPGPRTTCPTSRSTTTSLSERSPSSPTPIPACQSCSPPTPPAA